MNTILIKILKDEDSEVTREGKGEWSGDDIAWSIIIRGFMLSEEQYDYDFIMPAPDKEEYYLVYARYSTGSSFHHETGKVCLVSLMEHFDDAKAIVDAIDNDVKTENRQPLKVKLPVLGKVEDVYTGTWKGYFESLESVEIETVRKVRAYSKRYNNY